VAGVAVTGVVGMTTEAVVAGGIIGDMVVVIAGMVTAMDGATTADAQTQKKRRMKRRFFVPGINPTCGSELARDGVGSANIDVSGMPLSRASSLPQESSLGSVIR